MPRYFFDLVGEDGIDADEVGTVLADLAEVKIEAVRALAEILRPDLKQQGLRVRDERGVTLATVTMVMSED